MKDGFRETVIEKSGKPAAQLRTQVFHDMDEFVAMLQRQFEFSWESTQISTGRNSIKIDYLDLPELVFTFAAKPGGGRYRPAHRGFLSGA